MPLIPIVRCDGADCEHWAYAPYGSIPPNWIPCGQNLTFCSWLCTALYAAQESEKEQAQIRESAHAVAQEPEPVGAAS